MKESKHKGVYNIWSNLYEILAKTNLYHEHGMIHQWYQRMWVDKGFECKETEQGKLLDGVNVLYYDHICR
jgi:hypothetical protein